MGAAADRLVVESGEGFRPSTSMRGMGVEFKVPAELTDGAFSIVEHPVDPRALVPPHVHRNEDEFSFVIEGEIGARIGDVEVVVGPGAYVAKPRGILHTFWNPTDRPARILEIISPAGFERYFAEAGAYFESIGDGEVDPMKVMEIAQRYDLAFDFSWVPELVERYGVKAPA
jgi:mannose-6-phosphate isomerase-like protein (cupin superfamily)